MQVSGQFLLQVIGGDGSLKNSISQDNLVLDGIWNFINYKEFAVDFNVQLGTGDSEPNVLDVALNELIYECTDVTYKKIPGVDDGNTICLRLKTEVPAGKISSETVTLREIGLLAQGFYYYYGSRTRREVDDTLITRSLINSEDGGQLITPSDMIKITYDLRFTAPGGLMPQTSSLTINEIEHQVSYEVAKLGEIDIYPSYLLGSHQVGPAGTGGSHHAVAGWRPDPVKEVIIDRESHEIQVIWEKTFDEFSSVTVERLVLQKGSPSYLSGGNYRAYGRDYVTITFDPPIVKQEGERLTLNGVFKTTLSY